MKKILIFLAFLIISFSCESQNLNNKTMIEKLPKIAMDFSVFAKDFPEIINAETNGNKQYNIDAKVDKLDGRWAYNFVDNKLNWFMFNSYSDDLNQANFNKYLSVTQLVIDDFKQIYGEPDEFVFENKTYKDPYIERHWGYDVMSAVWHTDEMSFKIEFIFMGGKGEYNFLFKMNFQKSGYEYF